MRTALHGLAVSAAAVLLHACAQPAQPDAFGNVEATSTVVAAEASGRLVSFTATEGAPLAAGAVVGTIDPEPLALQRAQLEAQREATLSRAGELAQQARALEAQRAALRAQRQGLEAQREIAQRAYDRTRRLLAEQAATAQQLDQAERDVRVLANQITAQDEQIAAAGLQVAAVRAQQQTVARQADAVAAQVAQVSERIGKTEIRNPVAGTVLLTYVAPGEFVQPGRPLYKIADLGTVEVRAYITETQLSQVHVGQSARVSSDAGRGVSASAGTVTWIASEAEFTPTPIQTRDERRALVYAVTIRVGNGDRRLKIGMPVDVQFDPQAAAR